MLPQLITCFAMLDIFSYNSYQIRYTVWILAPIVVGIRNYYPRHIPYFSYAGAWKISG